MDLSRIDKKIAEAQFLLDKMSEQETRIIGDKEPFDYYLSAFLNAARTVLIIGCATNRARSTSLGARRGRQVSIRQN